MTPKQVLEWAQTETLIDGNGDRVELVVEPGLSRHEMAAFEEESHFTIPVEIRELLEYSRGVRMRSKWMSRNFYEDDQGLTIALLGRGCVRHAVWMDSVPAGLAPAGMEVASDIYGDAWVVEVRPSDWRWGLVFYICHDPPVIALQAHDLADFLEELFMLFSKKRPSRLITDPSSIEIVPMSKAATVRESRDPVLRAFAGTLQDRDLIADLRARKIGAGFPWDVFGRRTRLKRDESELIFALTH